ncbi:hypothetical protein D3C73_611760 [compost metagenome]
MAEHGGHVDDPAIAAPLHAGSQRSRHQKGRGQAGVDDAAKILKRQFVQVLADIIAGVVDQDVRVTKGVLNLLGGAGDIGLVGDVGDKALHRDARLGQLGAGLVQHALITRDQSQVRAGAAQGVGHRPTQAAAAAGDDGCSAGQVDMHCSYS